MSAKRVASLGALVLVGTAAVVLLAGAASIVATFGDLFVEWPIVAAVPLLLVPAALVSVGAVVRRRRRLGWILLLAGTGLASLALAFGWANVWSIRMADAASTVQFAGTDARPVDVATGSAHACALMDDGSVWCWGANLSNQVDPDGYRGEEPVDMSAAPAPVDGVVAATAIAASGDVTCALEHGRIECWGGQRLESCEWELGWPRCEPEDAQLPSSSVGIGYVPGLEGALNASCGQDGLFGCPGMPSTLDGITTMSLGESHACLVADGRVYCWGVDLNAELGSGAAPGHTPDDSSAPRWGNPVAGIETARTVSAGSGATCAGIQDANGGPDEVRCWGTSAYEAFGLERPEDAGVPFAVPDGVYPSPFPVNPWPLCADPATAPVRCDHYLRANETDDFWSQSEQVPTDVPDPIADLGTSCAAAADEAWCWGWVLGLRESGLATQAGPVASRIAGMTGVTRIASSAFTSCAIADGRVRCWGLGSAGQLGVPYPFGLLDVLVGVGLLALVGVAVAAAYGTMGVYHVDTRRKAALAGVPDGSLDLGRWSTLRLAVFVLASYAILWWDVAGAAGAALGHGPGALMLVSTAGALLAIVTALPGSGRAGASRRILGVVVMVTSVGLAISWIATDIGSVYLGRVPQPTVAQWLLDGAVRVPLAFVPLLVFLVPPMDPLLARGFREEFRRARTPRRRIALLFHPWRVFAAQATETERKRLASELHAEVLPGLYRSLQAAEDGGSVERLAQDLREAVDEVESMLTRRRSIVLEEVGLLAALEWLAERTEERGDITIEINVDDAGEPGRRPPRFVERAAFRVAQLALENVTRHAPGASVAMGLTIGPSLVRLVIADDGPGLGQTPAEAARAGHKGLADMDDEARSCGATLAVTSGEPAHGGGVGVTVTFAWTT